MLYSTRRTADRADAQEKSVIILDNVNQQGKYLLKINNQSKRIRHHHHHYLSLPAHLMK